MRTMMSALLCLFFFAALVAPVSMTQSVAWLDGPSVAQAASKKKSSAPKTQQVRSYTKKNGTKVQSYKRAAPR